MVVLPSSSSDTATGSIAFRSGAPGVWSSFWRLRRRMRSGVTFSIPRAASCAWAADHFCSQALPDLLAGAPQDVRLRRAVAKLAWPGHYAAIAALSRGQCASRRSRRRLHPLAALRPARSPVRDGGNVPSSARRRAAGRVRLTEGLATGRTTGSFIRDQVSGPSGERRRLDRARRHATRAFVTASLPADLPDWGGRVDLTRAGRGVAQGVGDARAGASST